MQQYHKNLLLLILAIAIPNNLYAEMYKYVDKNGKVSYTNITPPSTAQQVVTSNEVVEDPMDKTIRLRNDQIQREDAAKFKKYQQEQERILREKRRILIEDQKLIASQNTRIQQNNNSASNTNNLRFPENYVSKEKIILEQKQRNALDECRRSGQKYKQRKKCVEREKRKYRKKIASLQVDPQGYFYNQAQRNSRSNGNTPQHAIINEEWDTHGGNPQHTIINGEWDTQGQHYTPAGGGNAWRSDGTFMQKAAGGYIDTKTGQFVPAN